MRHLRINISISEDVHEVVKALKLKVSRICERALIQAIWAERKKEEDKKLYDFLDELERIE